MYATVYYCILAWPPSIRGLVVKSNKKQQKTTKKKKQILVKLELLVSAAF